MTDDNKRFTYYFILFLIYFGYNLNWFYLSQPKDDENTWLKDRFKLINDTVRNNTFNESGWGLPGNLKKAQLDLFSEKLIKEAKGRFYHNITGLVRGDWDKVKIIKTNDTNSTNSGTFNKSSSRKNEVKAVLTSSANGTLPTNFTDNSEFYKLFNNSDSGYMKFQLENSPFEVKDQGLEHDLESKGVKFLGGYLTLFSDIAQTESYSMLMEGVHIPLNGSIYLHGYSSGQDYNPSHLLDLLPNNQTYEVVKHFYKLKAKEQFNKFVELGENSMLVSNNSSSCYIQMLIQLSPFGEEVDIQQILLLEQELQEPLGIPTISPIPLITDLLIYSPNCPEMIIKSKKLKGYKVEVYYSKQNHYGYLVTFVGLISCYLMIHQMEYSSTPSMVTKISYVTLCMHTLIDGYLCLTHLTGSILLKNAKLIFLTSSLFLFVLLALFELRYLQMVIKITQPEGSVVRRRHDQGVLSLFFYLLILLIVYVGYMTFTSRGVWQSIALRSTIFILYSFWWPQIYRNLKRGTCKGLTKTYVFGTSLMKLIIPLYFFACPSNLLDIPIPEYISNWVYYLVIYVFIQILILWSQDWFGARWFAPKSLFPNSYNYHQLNSQPAQDEEQPFPPTQSDCSICMLPLTSDEPVQSNSSSHHIVSHSSDTNLPLLSQHQQPSLTAQSVLSRFTNSLNIMVTPCQHRFHTPCLEQWMRIKLECPVCRTQLPPI